MNSTRHLFLCALGELLTVPPISHIHPLAGQINQFEARDYNILAKQFKLHDTFNWEGIIHGPDLCPHSTSSETRGRAARQVMLWRLKDPLLQAYLYDRLYKILISGYYVGPNKPGRKDPTVGLCAACGVPKMFHTSFSTVQEPSNITRVHLRCGPPSLRGGINKHDRLFTPLIGPYY